MIEFRNVSQSYKDHKVLTDINMTIQSGEFVVLIGSSGCGKTTLLKTINKLTSLAGGDLLIDGVSIRDIPDIALAPPDRLCDPGRRSFPAPDCGGEYQSAAGNSGYAVRQDSGPGG